jgi:hypothetical protein
MPLLRCPQVSTIARQGPDRIRDARGRARARPDDSPLARRLVTATLLLSITLVRAAAALPHRTVLTVVVVVIFIAVAAWAAPRQRRNVLLTGSALLVFIYVGDVGLALVRGAQDGDYAKLTTSLGRIVLYLTTAFMALCALGCARDLAERDRRLRAIVLAPAIYALINLVLDEGGIHGASSATQGGAGGSAQLLGFAGLSAGRTVYPLATSINLYSIVASSAAAGVVVLRVRRPDLLPRIVAWPLALVCIYEVLAGDSRATLLWAVVVAAVFVIWRRFKGVPLIAWVMPFFPLIVIGILGLVANSGLAQALNRGSGTESVATGTGRLYIWRGAWAVLRHFRLEDLIGWGAAGQIPSGASGHYTFVFANDPLSYTVFTHSSSLQTLLDEGYIGLFILVLLLWRTFLLLKRHLITVPNSPVSALVAMLLVVVLSGATEVSPSYYSEEVLLLLLLVASAAVAVTHGRLAPRTLSEPHIERDILVPALPPPPTSPVPVGVPA